MVKKMNFCIVGGDIRQIFLSESLIADGHNVRLYGYSPRKINADIKIEKDIDETIEKSDFVILPIPSSRDGKTLNSPLSNEEINLDDKLADKLKDKIVFCGGAKIFYELGEKWKNINFKDYALREDFAILNAVPSAEGAIQIAINESDKTISSGKFLVIGFGKLGKVLSKILKAMGAEVTVSARSASDIAWIESLGYEAAETNNLPWILDYDLIFNTVPHKIFDRNNLLKCAPGTKIIDLASKPGGVDVDLAEFLDIKVIHALGLPGKFSPKTSGEIIKKIIYKILEEEKLWKKSE